MSDEQVQENFVSEEAASVFAARYKESGLHGGHVILLGSGNELAAAAALAAYPGGLQLGGGVTPSNARDWLDRGASQVIVTSYLFDTGRFSFQRLEALLRVVEPSELVVDLSCRRASDGWRVATNRWQTVTETRVTPQLLDELSTMASELLVHAADVEGLCQGIDEDLVRHLGAHSPLPCTYAGGARTFSDLALVEDLSDGRLDLTIGSALDIFGGAGVRYADCVEWNRSRGYLKPEALEKL